MAVIVYLVSLFWIHLVTAQNDGQNSTITLSQPDSETSTNLTSTTPTWEQTSLSSVSVAGLPGSSTPNKNRTLSTDVTNELPGGDVTVNPDQPGQTGGLGNTSVSINSEQEKTSVTSKPSKAPPTSQPSTSAVTTQPSKAPPTSQPLTAAATTRTSMATPTKQTSPATPRQRTSTPAVTDKPPVGVTEANTTTTTESIEQREDRELFYITIAICSGMVVLVLSVAVITYFTHRELPARVDIRKFASYSNV